MRLSWNEVRVRAATFRVLFQSVMEPAQRRAQGAHYTTEKNILKVIEPLFMDDLRAEFERLKSRAPYPCSKRIRKRVPVACATFSSVRMDGGTRPLSILATADCVVFIRTANSTWVKPASVRALINARATSNSGPSFSYALR